ncbi:MAG: Ig-like domain-containing protein, partial [Bacillota bacterium]|nr:Ig-like domain-containing protein [Bacillota bacterium]
MKKTLAIMLVFLMVFSFSNISYFASFAVADPTPTTKTLTGNKHFVEVTHYDVSGLTAEGDAAEWENNALNTISGTFSKKAKLGNDIWTKANNEDAFLKSTSSGSQKNAQVITGFIKPNQNIVELRVLVDDGIRWVIGENNITVVDSWEVQEAEYHSKSINLEKDKGYKFTIEYFDWGGQGALELEFKKANGGWQKFPQEWFYESGKNPKAVDDTKEMDEDTSIDIDVLDNDKNIDSLTEVSIKTDPAHGEVEVLANRKIKYTPDENYFGEDEFEYELSGGSSATVSITIYNKTDIPVARDDVANTDEDTPVDIYVLDNDGPDDISGLQMENEPISEMEIVSVTTPENGSAVIVSGEYITYTPNPDWNGTDEFYYTMSNGIGNTLDAKVTVTVNPVYDEPVANNDDVSIREDNDKNIKVLKNDEHIDEDVTDTVVEVISGPSHGTAIVLTNRKIKYEPTDDYYGSDEFEYELDGISSAIVSIMVYN